jgi:hypothetical protein
MSPLSMFLAQTESVTDWNAYTMGSYMMTATNPNAILPISNSTSTHNWGHFNGNSFTPDQTTVYSNQLPFHFTSDADTYNAYNSMAEAPPSTIPLPTTTTPDTNDALTDDGTANAKKRKRNREEEENALLMLPEGSRRTHKPRRLPDGESAVSFHKK